MTRLILPILILAMLTTGLFIQLRHRSPYKGVTMDDQSKKRYMVGWWISAVGTVAYIVERLLAS